MNALAREPSAKEKKCTTDTSGIEHVTSHPHGIHCFAALMLVSAVRKYADLSGYLLRSNVTFINVHTYSIVTYFHLINNVWTKSLTTETGLFV